MTCTCSLLADRTALEDYQAAVAAVAAEESVQRPAQRKAADGSSSMLMMTSADADADAGYHSTLEQVAMSISHWSAATCGRVVLCLCSKHCA